MNRIGQFGRRPSAGLSKVALIVVLFLVLLVVLPIAFVLLSRPAAPTVNIPSPNAVDTLAEASSRMTGHIELMGEKSMEELEDVAAIRNFLSDNSEAMELYRTAVSQECVPVVDYDKGMQAVFDDNASINFRTALHLPRAAARLAQLENRPNEAAKTYAEMFALASKYGSEGLLFHTQLGFAYERLALKQLKGLADSLDPTTRDEVRQLIESADRQQRDFDAILRRDRVLLNNDHGAAQMAYMKFMLRSMPNDALKKSKDTDSEILVLLGEVIEKLK